MTEELEVEFEEVFEATGDLDWVAGEEGDLDFVRVEGVGWFSGLGDLG